MIECLICHRKFTRIHTHLKIHKISCRDYLILFPGSLLESPEISKKRTNILRIKYWNTTEFSKKESESHLGKLLSGKSIAKRTKTRRKNGWNKNPEQTSKRHSDSMKGKESWCKDLTKETDQRIAYRSKKVAESLQTPEVRNKFKKLSEKNWCNPEYALKVSQHWANKPNKKEREFDNWLQELFPNEWKYVGDGYTWIAGKNPDYLNINGKKQVIELLGCYWHGCKIHCPDSKYKDDSDKLIDHFKQYGFNCLVIWEHELKDKNLVIEKVKNFMV